MRPGSGACKIWLESTLSASFGVSFRGGMQADTTIVIAMNAADWFLVVALIVFTVMIWVGRSQFPILATSGSSAQT